MSILKEYLSQNGETTIVVVASGDGPDQLVKLLECIQRIGNEGHSFNIVVDPDDHEGLEHRTFGWDGDGSDRIRFVKRKDNSNE
jgi:hypothetical protein